MYHGLSRPASARVDHQPPPGHDRWQRGRLRGHLRLRLTPSEGGFVSPGTGVLEARPDDGGEVVTAAAARRRGVPVVPGSGIKGAVRTLYELTSASCDPTARRAEGRSCGCRSCCEACSLFGCLGYQGRLGFDDAVPAATGVAGAVHWVPTPHEPHGEKTGGDFRLYDLDEAVYQGQVRDKDLAREVYRGVFETRMRFVNLEEGELGRVFFCMGLAIDERETFALRLGGAKYDGGGAVEVQPIELVLFEGPLSRTRLLDQACHERCKRAMVAAKESPWAGTFWSTLAAVAEILRRRAAP